MNTLAPITDKLAKLLRTPRSRLKAAVKDCPKNK
jgi:hypothetical protein